MKAGQKVFKYIKADNAASYGLDEEVSVVLMGDDVAYAGKTLVPREYTTKDGSLSIKRMEGGLEFVRLTAHPFPAESRLWNGPDVIANSQYRSMLASLFHDLIWEHADELAKAWGVSKQDVLRWGDGVLYALWMYASEDSIRGRIEARVAWQVCEFSRGWYHSLKKILGLHCLAFALLLAGCGTPPDWTVAEISGTNAIHRAMGQKQSEIAQGEGVPAPAQAEDVPGTADSASPASSDAVDFASLDWAWGGFQGKSAKPVAGVEIGSLKVSGGGMSYKWIAGGCEKLGASNREDADHTLACLFVRIGGKWQGGKFDWTSTSRTSRDFKNVRDGAYAFCIVSKDGKKRTNVIVQEK